MITGGNSAGFRIDSFFSARRNESVAAKTRLFSFAITDTLDISGFISESAAENAVILTPRINSLFGISTSTPETTGSVGKSS